MRSTSILQKQSTTTDDWCAFQIDTDQRADKQSTKTDERHVKRYKQSTQRTMGHDDINCTVISTTTTQQSTNNGYKIKMSTTDRDRNQEANDNEPAAPVPRTPARRPAQLKDSDDSLDNAGVPVVTPARPTARATEQSRPTRAAPHPRDPTNSPPRQRPRVASQFSRNASRHTRLPLSGQASSGGWKLVWDIPPDANDPNLNALIEAARTADLWPDDFIAVVEQNIEVRQQQPLFANTTETVPVLAGLTDQFNRRCVQLQYCKNNQPKRTVGPLIQLKRINGRPFQFNRRCVQLQYCKNNQPQLTTGALFKLIQINGPTNNQPKQTNVTSNATNNQPNVRWAMTISIAP